MEQIEPGEGDQAKQQPQPQLAQQPTPTFAPFGIQPRTSMSAHCVRRFVVPSLALRSTLTYTARCPVCFVTESS